MKTLSYYFSPLLCKWRKHPTLDTIIDLEDDFRLLDFCPSIYFSHFESSERPSNLGGTMSIVLPLLLFRASNFINRVYNLGLFIAMYLRVFFYFGLPCFILEQAIRNNLLRYLALLDIWSLGENI